MHGWMLTFPGWPPGPTLLHGSQSNNVAPQALSQPLGRVLTLSMLGLWERNGSVTFPSPQASLGQESWAVGREESQEAGEIQAETAEEELSSWRSRGITGSLRDKAGNCVFSV